MENVALVPWVVGSIVDPIACPGQIKSALVRASPISEDDHPLLVAWSLEGEEPFFKVLVRFIVLKRGICLWVGLLAWSF